MSDRLGLMRAIQDQPDDDGLRLVFADWLEDNADPERAEFIRVQIERVRLPEEDDRQADLEARERRLLLKHADRWVPAELPLSWTRFRRGMPEVLGPSPSWLTDEQIDSLGPLPIRDLWLFGGEEEVDTGRIREMELMERIEGLRLLDRFSSSDTRDLLSSSQLGKLRWLDLEGAALNESDMGRTLDLKAVAGVERLVLRFDHLSDESADRLLRIKWPNLREWTFCTSRLTTPCLESLLGSGLWQRLDSIALWAQQEAADRLAASLCQRSAWGALRDLRLREGSFAGGLFERLLDHPAMTGLRHLSLVNRAFTANQFDRLANSPNLANLSSLSLGGPVPILWPLSRSPHLTRLNHVDGWGDDVEVIGFVNSTNASHVRSLKSPTFSVRVARAIAGSPHMSRLTTLAGNATLSDEAAEALADSPHLKCLTWIGLDTSHLSARGQQALLEAEHLGWVGIPENQVKTPHLRKLWRQRYGDGERVSLLRQIM